MLTLSLTPDELRYLAQLNGQNVFVLERLGQQGRPLPDLAVAQQIQAKLAALLPEKVPDPWANLRSVPRPQAPARRSSRKER